MNLRTAANLLTVFAPDVVPWLLLAGAVTVAVDLLSTASDSRFRSESSLCSPLLLSTSMVLIQALILWEASPAYVSWHSGCLVLVAVYALVLWRFRIPVLVRSWDVPVCLIFLVALFRLSSCSVLAMEVATPHREDGTMHLLRYQLGEQLSELVVIAAAAFLVSLGRSIVETTRLYRRTSTWGTRQ